MKEYTLEDMVEFMKKEFQLETQIRDSAGSYDYSYVEELDFLEGRGDVLVSLITRWDHYNDNTKEHLVELWQNQLNLLKELLDKTKANRAED